MSKKIIAAVVALTLTFLCVFAACNKSGTYTNPKSGKEYELVTDENGEKVLNDDGELLVYAKDENGKYVTDESGERVTAVQGFIGQIEEDGIVEDYAYTIELPDGWKADKDTFGVFNNKSKGESIEISIVEYLYSDYYDMNKSVYDSLKDSDEVQVKWEEDLELIDGAENTCRFTMSGKDGATAILLIFENSDNVYKVRFSSESGENAWEDCNAFCQAIKFKNYTYYPDVTARSTTEEQ